MSVIDPNDTATATLPGIPLASVAADRVQTHWQCACRYSSVWMCTVRRGRLMTACKCPCHVQRFRSATDA